MAENRERNVKEDIRNERIEIVRQLEDWLEMPMLILSIIWLGLFVAEMVWGLSPFLETAGAIIWMIFGIDFAIKLILAPQKLDYLKANWLTALALLLPAFRIFRAFRAFRLLRAARAARGLRLVRLLTSVNRGMRALGVTFSRRGFGYVLLLSAIVVFGGAAGIYSLEREVQGGFATYADAVWWTAMILISIGTEYFPQTGEGRLLCFAISVYGFAVFGYVTATLATFFVQRDTEEAHIGEPTIADLHREIRELRKQLAG
ncbi:MAG: potassium channel family protein [Pyrinomonadaceae bacterium]|nr:potassium channel family protein [Pyrinomonadaceae bacterium]